MRHRDGRKALWKEAMTPVASALHTRGLQPVHLHFRACSLEVFALGLPPQVAVGRELIIFAFVCPSNGTLTGRPWADAECLEPACRDTDHSEDAFSGVPSTWEQLDQQSSSVFNSAFLSLIDPCLIGSCLPSHPIFFLHFSWKATGFFTSMSTYVQGPGDTKDGRHYKKREENIPKKLIYTRTPPTVGSWPPKEPERISRGSEALEPRAHDLPTSVVSEGRAIFLIQFPLPHKHQYTFSSP